MCGWTTVSRLAGTLSSLSLSLSLCSSTDLILPCRDKGLSVAFLKVNVEYALKPRQLFPWAGDVPECVWLNAVLPYAR